MTTTCPAGSTIQITTSAPNVSGFRFDYTVNGVPYAAAATTPTYREILPLTADAVIGHAVELTVECIDAPAPIATVVQSPRQELAFTGSDQTLPVAGFALAAVGFAMWVGGRRRAHAR